MYSKFIKRIFDFTFSLIFLIAFSPIILAMTVIGAIKMKGNPFFVQERPGKNERIFKLIKFRTMTNEKDKSGNFLPDSKRLVKYGIILRSTSLDELPELLNILKGDMSFVGPRPLLVEYLPWYTDKEKHRHDVRPGLTGLAQINGRNSLGWDERLNYDIKYVSNITFCGDLRIVITTIQKVLFKSGVEADATDEGYLSEIRRKKALENIED